MARVAGAGGEGAYGLYGAARARGRAGRALRPRARATGRLKSIEVRAFCSRKLQRIEH